MTRAILSILLLLVATTSQANLRIYHIDVEQADATLIVSPTGESMLVDTGKNGHGGRLKAAMGVLGITQIDHLIITHYHEDHYGGADDLLKSPGAVPVVNVHDRGDKTFLPSAKRNQTTFKDYETALGHRAHHIMRGETINLGPQVLVTCISSGGVVIGETNPQFGHDENDMSVSLLVQFGDFRYFVGGDIESFTELKIADLDAVTDIDAYQANHHGSHSSTSDDFIEDLLPTVAIISNGNTTKYQHPRQVTLTTLSGLTPPTTVFQTNRYLSTGSLFGNVPNARIADPETTDTDGNILIRVEGSNYTVSYGTTTQSFAIKSRTDASGMIIARVLPDPVGSDRELEEVTLLNQSASTVALDEWVLMDKGGRVWQLSGSVAAGEEKTVVRAGQAMSLDNDGDTITLRDGHNTVVDTLSYGEVNTDARIFHP